MSERPSINLISISRGNWERSSPLFLLFVIVKWNICMAIYLYPAAEDHDYSCGIFQNFSKPFDAVTHKILLTKLEYYAIRGFVRDWFSSYLSNRTQTVSLGSVISEMQTVFCGTLPQASVLRPLLFLIYMNDFHSCPKLLDFHLLQMRQIHFLSIRTLTNFK